MYLFRFRIVLHNCIALNQYALIQNGAARLVFNEVQYIYIYIYIYTVYIYKLQVVQNAAARDLTTVKLLIPRISQSSVYVIVVDPVHI